MVDALSEIRRCLRPGGTLVDMRPVAWHSSLDIVTAEKSIRAGEISDTGMDAEDAAADAAMAMAVARGWFVPQGEVRFGFYFYWDSVDEMVTFVEESRRAQKVTPPADELDKRFASVNATSNDDVRLRCKRRIMLATYSSRTP